MRSRYCKEEILIRYTLKSDQIGSDIYINDTEYIGKVSGSTTYFYYPESAGEFILQLKNIPQGTEYYTKAEWISPAETYGMYDKDQLRDMARSGGVTINISRIDLIYKNSQISNSGNVLYSPSKVTNSINYTIKSTHTSNSYPSAHITSIDTNSGSPNSSITLSEYDRYGRVEFSGNDVTLYLSTESINIPTSFHILIYYSDVSSHTFKYY